MRVPYFLSYADCWESRMSAGYPQCNGQIECFNRTLIGMMKSYLKEKQTEWDWHSGCLVAAYRATPHESTGITPNLLILG